MLIASFLTEADLTQGTTQSDDQLAENIPYLVYESLNGSSQTDNLSDLPDTSLLANESNVLFYFYSRTVNGTLVNTNNVSKIPFSASKETLFVIHGWTNDYQSEMPQSVKDAYLQSGDVNVFVPDWSYFTKKSYVTAKYFLSPVGKFMAAFIQHIVDTMELNLKNTGLVGHSLGAHVAGVIGLALNSTVDHIEGISTFINI